MAHWQWGKNHQKKYEGPEHIFRILREFMLRPLEAKIGLK
jgi:hypothetical protein